MEFPNASLMCCWLTYAAEDYGNSSHIRKACLGENAILQGRCGKWKSVEHELWFVKWDFKLFFNFTKLIFKHNFDVTALVTAEFPTGAPAATVCGPLLTSRENSLSIDNLQWPVMQFLTLHLPACRRILQRCLLSWRQLPRLQREERVKEGRRERLAWKVVAVLPDFQLQLAETFWYS